MKNTLKLFHLVFTILVLIALISCKDDNTVASIPAEGTLKVRIDRAMDQSGREHNEKPHSIVLTVADSSGNLVLNTERINVFQIGAEYFSENIILEVGTYEVRDFLVLDSAGNTIFVAPKAGSEFAEFVNDPLPVSFNIYSDLETTVLVEVLAASLGDASDFGYAVFSFEVIDPLTDQLIAFFDFKGDADDRVDSLITGNVNGATLVKNRLLEDSSAYLFDGVDDFIEMGDVLDFGSNDFSFSVSVNINEFIGLRSGTNSRGAQIINKGTTIFGTPRRAGYSLKAMELDSQNVFSFIVGSQNDEIFSVTTTQNFETNRWYTVVCTKSANSIKIYVDGELAASNTIPSDINLDSNIPFVVGSINKLGNDPQGTFYFSGKIDDIRFYSKELSPTLIELLK